MRVLSAVTKLLGIIAGVSAYDTVFAFGDSNSALCGSGAMVAAFYCPAWNTFTKGNIKSEIKPSMPPKRGLNYLQYLTGCTSGDPSDCPVRLFDLATAGAFIGGAADTDVGGPVNLYEQTQQFLNHLDHGVRWKSSQTLFVYYIGMNDVHYQYSTKLPIDLIEHWFYHKLMSVTGNLIDLVDAGARNFLFLSIPDVSSSPTNQENHLNYRETIILFNTALVNRLDQLQIDLDARLGNFDHTSIEMFDTWSLYKEILEDPSKFNIENTNEEANVLEVSAATTHFWYDQMHTTQRVNQIMADRIREKIGFDHRISHHGPITSIMRSIQHLTVAHAGFAALLSLIGLYLIFKRKRIL